MPFDAITLAVLSALFVGALVRATFGFGNALLAMPVLALLVGPRTAAPVVALVALLGGVVILAEDWRQVHFTSAWRLLVSAAAGIPLGVLGLTHLPAEAVLIVLGAVVLGFAAWNLVHPRRFHLALDWPAYAFGFVAGILGGAYNTNGPPVVIYGQLRGWSPPQFRATLQSLFVPAGVLTALCHGAAGLWTPVVLHLWLWSLPTTIVAIVLGRWLSRRLSREKFVLGVNVFLVFMGAALVVRAVWSML